jgi:RNA polymerase sigma-70 factor (ECF subfamily)
MAASSLNRSADSESFTERALRRAVAGDATGLGYVVERLRPLLLEQAGYRLGPRLRRHYDPEDLVSDAWLRILPELKALVEGAERPVGLVLRWLSTAIFHRTQNLVKKFLRGGFDAPPPLDFEAIPDPSDPRTGVVTAVARSDDAGRIGAAIATLDEKDREILVLRGIEQQSPKTVALLLGVPESTATMRWTRALARLREALPGAVFDDLD